MCNNIMEFYNMAISNKLSNLSKSFKKVAPITASFTNIPDGEYIGDLKEMKLGESKKGRTQVELTWEVADGDLAGKTQKQFYGLSDNAGNADEVGMGYFKNVCEVLGIDLSEDLNVWQEEMNEFVAVNQTLYDIAVKSNGNYANVYCNGDSGCVKGTGEEETTEETAEETTEEEMEVSEVEEEAVEEEVGEDVQEVVVPKKKIVAKVVAKVAVPVKKAAVAQPVKKTVMLKRR